MCSFVLLIFSILKHLVVKEDLFTSWTKYSLITLTFSIFFSSAGIISLLDEEEPQLKVRAGFVVVHQVP